MSRLVRVEVRRLLARRLLRVLVAALLGGLAVAAIVTALHSSRDLAAARARAEREVAAYQVQQAESEKQCEAAKAAGQVPPDVSCAYVGQGPTAEQAYVDPRYHFARAAPDAVAGAIVGAGMLAVVLGASAIGAEWSAGTFAGLLTWEPRRLRVLAAKLLALAAVVATVAVIAVALEMLVAWGIAGTRGTVAGTTSHVVRDLLWRGARGVGLASLLGIAAAAGAGILRSTAGALGAAGAYLVGFEMLSRGLRPGWQRWLLSSNAAALVSGKIQIFPPVQEAPNFGTLTPAQPFVLHASRAAVVLSLGTAALVALWGFLLRRRDVT